MNTIYGGLNVATEAHRYKANTSSHFLDLSAQAPELRVKPLRQDIFSRALQKPSNITQPALILFGKNALQPIGNLSENETLPIDKLFSDVDGTIRDVKSYADAVPERVKTSIQELPKQGVTVIPTTGRPVKEAVKIARDIGMQGEFFLITEHGAVVSLVHTDNSLTTLYQQGLPLKTVQQVKTLLDEFNGNSDDPIHMIVFYQGSPYCLSPGIEKPAGEAIPYIKSLAPSTKLQTYLSRIGRYIPSINSYTHRKGFSPLPKAIAPDNTYTKIILYPKPPIIDGELQRYGDQKKASRLEKVLTDHLAELGNVTILRSPTGNVEVINKDVSKGNAIRWLVNHQGWNKKHTAGIGDEPTDIPMFVAVRVGIAMGNAHGEDQDGRDIKEVAQYITNTVSQGGFADAANAILALNAKLRKQS